MVIGENARFLRSSLMPLVEKKYVKSTGVTLDGLETATALLSDVHSRLVPTVSVVFFISCIVSVSFKWLIFLAVMQERKG